MLRTDVFCWKLLGVSFNYLKHLVSIINTETLYLVEDNSAETEVCHWCWLKCLLRWGEFKYFHCSVWCLNFFSLNVNVCVYIYIKYHVFIKISCLYCGCFGLGLCCCCTEFLWASQDKPIHSGHRQAWGEVFPVSTKKARVRMTGRRDWDKLRF